jgi:hypothetical protein
MHQNQAGIVFLGDVGRQIEGAPGMIGSVYRHKNVFHAGPPLLASYRHPITVSQHHERRAVTLIRVKVRSRAIAKLQ